jgi:hypothetical protein
MTGRWLSLGVVLSVVLGGLVACTQETAGDSGQPAQARQPILYGTEAIDEAQFGAVGALMYEAPYGMDQACSGTLIAPNAVVTAKHCTKYIDQGPTYMAFGFDAAAPDQMIPITSYVVAPDSRHNPGLLKNGGRDLAVVYLESAPVGIQPAKLGHFTNCMLGKQFQIAGYGYLEWGFYGYRFTGPATARAIAGAWYPLLFNGDKQAYLDWYWTDSTAATYSDEEAEDWWTSYQLEPGYELLAGGLAGESLGCYGDSGGPIFLRNRAGELTVYGVSFAVEGSYSSICTLGAAYLVFNRHMFEFVHSAIDNHRHHR